MDMIKMLPQEIENKIFYMVAEHPCARMIKHRRNELFLKRTVDLKKDRQELYKSLDNSNNLHDGIIKKLYYTRESYLFYDVQDSDEVNMN
jgi:hypothetical protein